MIESFNHDKMVEVLQSDRLKLIKYKKTIAQITPYSKEKAKEYELLITFIQAFKELLKNDVVNAVNDKIIKSELNNKSNFLQISQKLESVVFPSISIIVNKLDLLIEEIKIHKNIYLELKDKGINFENQIQNFNNLTKKIVTEMIPEYVKEKVAVAELVTLNYCNCYLYYYSNYFNAYNKLFVDFNKEILENNNYFVSWVKDFVQYV